MIRKSVERFSEKIMRKQKAKARWRFDLSHRALGAAQATWQGEGVTSRRSRSQQEPAMSNDAKPLIRRAPRGMRWPGDRHVAVVFNVAYEAWTENGASAIGPMGNPLRPGVFDLNADSYGRYGANAGIRRLMG